MKSLDDISRHYPDCYSLISGLMKLDEEVMAATEAKIPVGRFTRYVGRLWFKGRLPKGLLVLTDTRLVFILIDNQNKPLGSTTEVAVGSIKNMKFNLWRFPKAWGRMKIEYSDGSTETFFGIDRGQGMFLMQMYETDTSDMNNLEAVSRRPFCASCKTSLRREDDYCPSCQVRFKSAAKAIGKEMLWSGRGYRYFNLLSGKGNSPGTNNSSWIVLLTIFYMPLLVLGVVWLRSSASYISFLTWVTAIVFAVIFVDRVITWSLNFNIFRRVEREKIPEHPEG